MKNIFLFLAVGLFIAAPGSGFAAGAEHDWNLGATGLRGWMHCDRLVTSDARQIAITRVDAGSPADGVLAVGDVILGVDGRVGSLAPGKDGDVAVFDGDPFEYVTHCTAVVIDGRMVSDAPR